ncbi:sodium:solute symporter family transporter [Compostibacter hankyongensis]|uniref:Sodium:solute symporter n=1 Tax=Compostibacter hankyongensis TaxID=1007089 RepID=A0ABP8FKE8_9BACT
MRLTDWIVLIATLAGIIIYGVVRGRGQRSMEGYFLGNQSLPWYVVLFSIVGTQASAVTFLSAPGQAFTDGMRFVQYYFGLPLAMIVLCVTFVPIFHRLKVFTAYEFLENRFDIKTRALTSLLFLLQRGLSTGISIYAPSIILSSLLGWNIYWTNVIMGGLLIIYTVSGGTKAVARTQQLQFFIIFAGMFLAGYMVVKLLPEGVSFSDALHVSGKLGKLNVIVTDFDWKDKYNIWSGVIGGFFLALSYFGTDQSQVGRYLTAKSVRESRIGLLMNGVVKVPMQFLILLIGALLLVFYQFYESPVLFNKAQLQQVRHSPYAGQLNGIQRQYDELARQKKEEVQQMIGALHRGDEAAVTGMQRQLGASRDREAQLRADAQHVIKQADPAADTNDTNYIFLYFVLDKLPAGLVGLLIAIIFLAAWGSIAAALNSLSSTTIVDFYQRLYRKDRTDIHYLNVSRWCTLFWGIFCILVAQFANRMGSLIEAVNVLGSLFYGTILGVFLVAFYLKKVTGTPTFWAALITEGCIILIYWWNIVSFLWLNVIGCAMVLLLAVAIQYFYKKNLPGRQENKTL